MIDYIFASLGLAAIGGIIWLLFCGIVAIRSIKRYRGTWQGDLFDEGRGEW